MKAYKRLFLVFPMMIVFICLCVTVVVPLIYWICTGEDFIELKNDIIKLGD